MKQKIVINVQMPCESCRSKAMKIAVQADGVTKVEIQGAGKDQLTVIGDGVDSVKLALSLRKKLGFASILSVEEEKDKKETEEKKKKENEKEELGWPLMNYHPYPPQYVVCDAPNPSVCSIM